MQLLKQEMTLCIMGVMHEAHMRQHSGPWATHRLVKYWCRLMKIYKPSEPKPPVQLAISRTSQTCLHRNTTAKARNTSMWKWEKDLGHDTKWWLQTFHKREGHPLVVQIQQQCQRLPQSSPHLWLPMTHSPFLILWMIMEQGLKEQER